MKLRLSRRAVLRGLGAGIALPALDAMLDDRGLLLGRARGAPAPFPQRLMTFFIPNGVPVLQGRDHSRWEPATVGTGYAITPCLKPIEAFRDDFNVLSGLPLGVTQNVGNGHSRGGGAFATGMDIVVQGATGPSIDQIAASKRGAATRLRSLVVDSQGRFTSDCGNEAVPNCYNLSWSGPLQPVPAESDPVTLFGKLFGGGSPSATGGQPDFVRRERQSVIDFVTRDIGRLQARLGAADRDRLDAHLTSIRELERELASLAAPVSCTAPAAPDPAKVAPVADGYSTERARMLLKLIAMAFRCDITRYVSFRLGQVGTNRGPGGTQIVTGATQTNHEAVHHGDLASIQAFTVYHMTQFAYLLSQLKGDATTREGNGYLLDNTLVYLGSEMFDGATHRNDLQPVVLAGRAGGRVVTGRHIQYKGSGKSVGNMLLAMLQLVDVPVAQLGKNTEPLPGLTS